MYIQDLNTPYEVIDNDGISYDVCVDYQHISRYRNLRQIVHNVDNFMDRFISLETPNPFVTNTTVRYYEVPNEYEDRLDLVAKDTLGLASYSWVIAYFNGISDGYSIKAGQRLRIPNSITTLFNSGEVLAPIPVMALNLGAE